MNDDAQVIDVNWVQPKKDALAFTEDDLPLAQASNVAVITEMALKLRDMTPPLFSRLKVTLLPD